MGQEIACRAQFGGKSSVGKALLESREILFRGDFRLKIPVASMKEIKAVDGQLLVKTAEGVAVFDLGDAAVKWRDKLRNPKSLIEKLGVKAGDTVTLHGSFDKQFQETLKQHGATIGTGGSAPWIFFQVEGRRDLSKIKTIANQLEGTAALWLVYPKGQKTIAESHVRQAVLKQGLKDVKVASFSDTHTALKVVLPENKR